MDSVAPENGERAATVVPLHAPVDDRHFSAPDVTIVLICYNDARRLGRAIRSLTNQTLRSLEIVVVDDASTDDTAAVVQREMAKDARIRYVRLEENSGGCSAPRNRGIDEARGTWIMFCDSDDVYERHAAKNLLLAVEASGAELGCAVAERVDVATGRARRWHAELHEPAVLDGIMQRPELIADTISVNKIYRTDWLRAAGIRFPEGILYEDQLFTMQAYASARTIAVLEETSYRWYVGREPAEASITQRRAELGNATSRIAVNRLIDAYLAATGRSDLRHVKDAKFLRHDFTLHATALLDADEVTGSAIVREFGEYLRSMDLSSVGDLQPGLRIAVFHVLVGDLPGVQSAMRNVSWGGSLDVPVVADAEGTAWACEHYDPLEVGGSAGASTASNANMVSGRPVRWWLDLTDSDPLLIPRSQQPWCHVLDGMAPMSRGIDVTGSTVDAFGLLSNVIRADLALVTSAPSVIATLPLLWRQVADGHWAWSTDGPWEVPPHAALLSTSQGMVCLRLQMADGGISLAPIRSVRRPALSIRRPRALRPIGPQAPAGLEVSSGPYGTLSWRAGRPAQGAGSRATLLHQRLSTVRSGGWKWAVQRLALLLPLRDAVVFSAGDGRRVDGDPWVLSQAWHVSHPDVEQVWVHAGIPERVPSWAAPVDRRSWRYQWVLARARWWVDDHGIGSPMRKRRGQRNLHTASGIPILRMGVEDPQWLLAPRSARRPAPATIRRWDALLVGSPFADAHLADALGFTGQRVQGAWPWLTRVRTLREARFSSTGDAGAEENSAGRLRVLLAPVHPELITAGLDLISLAQSLGRQIEFTVRRPDGRPVPIPSGMAFALRDAGSEDDTAGLVANSDLLITDASNWALAAVDVGMPVLWVDVADLPANVQPLRRSPGFTIEDDRRSPLVRSTSEAIAALRSWLADADSSRAGRESGNGSPAHRDVGDLLQGTEAAGVDQAWQALRGRS